MAELLQIIAALDTTKAVEALRQFAEACNGDDNERTSDG